MRDRDSGASDQAGSLNDLPADENTRNDAVGLKPDPIRASAP